ncbi:unnamed protein product [Soboliphyme baturini]|uniref:Uncharacterized protein n=1 Tax=Soboliphyme baturini TaxID=241478 RepID=A0A183IAZ5_9BILA|nr:unnamed protein product [Soboliphyme baturini]
MSQVRTWINTSCLTSIFEVARSSTLNDQPRTSDLLETAPRTPPSLANGGTPANRVEMKIIWAIVRGRGPQLLDFSRAHSLRSSREPVERLTGGRRRNDVVVIVKPDPVRASTHISDDRVNREKRICVRIMYAFIAV